MAKGVPIKATPEDMIEALRKFNGNVSAAADFLSMGRSTLHYHIHREGNEHVAKALDEARERNLDELEDELYTQARNGNIAALIFALKTQGYRRGYIENKRFDVNAVFNDGAREKNAKKDADYLASVFEELEDMDEDDSEEESDEIDFVGDTE